MMLERRVESIIHATMYHQAVEPPSDSQEVPTVLLNCYSEHGSWASVVPDEVSGGHTATDILLSRGHKRVGFINLPAGSRPRPADCKDTSGRSRTTGYPSTILW